MVLIRGIDKPKSCGSCEIGGGFCNEYAHRNWSAPPPDDCPIVSVYEMTAKMEAAKFKEERPIIEKLCYNRGVTDCINILLGSEAHTWY